MLKQQMHSQRHGGALQAGRRYGHCVTMSGALLSLNLKLLMCNIRWQ